MAVLPVRWRRPGALRLAAGGAAWWLAALVTIWVVLLSPRHVVSAGTAIVGLLGVGVVVLAARHPDRSLLILIVLLPFQALILARLYAAGVPASIVRHASAWKEALALGVVLAGARGFYASGRRADKVDRLALGFVALAAVYLLLGPTIVPGAPSSMSVRLLAFRQDAGFVLVLLGARHAPLPPGFMARAGRATLAVATVVGAVCIFEALDSSGWNRFVVNTVKYTRYESEVLNTKPLNYNDIRIYGTIGGTQIVRAGSVFLSALTCGFYLVLGFAVGLERTVRGRSSPLLIVSLALIGAGLLLTQTRSAILAALIVAFLAFQPSAGRRRHWRTQLGILVAALALMAVPAVVSTGLAHRVAGTGNSADQSSASHVSALATGLHTLEHHPLGLGLGTSAGTGQRFATQTAAPVIPENNYLELGIELGVLGTLVFVALTVALLLALRRAARQVPEGALSAAMAAVAGLAVAALFLQPWIDFSVDWTVWAIAGAALGAARLAPVTAAARAPLARPPAVANEPIAA